MKEIESPLWQTSEWEQFQKTLGMRVTRVGHSLLLKYPIFFGMRYGYMPRGPVNRDTEKPNEFFDELKRYAKKKKLLFIRIDPEQEIKIPKKVRTITSHSPQPETTLILDLSKSEEELLKQMKRKGRYNITLAEKKGVKVKRAESIEEQKNYAAIFYRLLKETTQRDNFSGHDEHYYQTMLKELPMSEIFIAYYDDEPVSGAICTYQPSKAIYYYGASGNKHREVMAPYLIQWEAIREAKRRGCESYDFLGIAPESATSDHPWKGITDFKTKFGGAVVQYPQAMDLVYRPLLYKFYKVLKFLQKIIKK